MGVLLFNFRSKRLHGAKAQFPANQILILTPCAMLTVKEHQSEKKL